MNSPPNFCFYEFEGFVLDPLQRVLRKLTDGQAVNLTARAFDTLHLLVSHHGQLVEKETLIKTLWPKVVVEDNNLTQIIHALRQNLGEKPGEHRFIATAPGRGYRFVAPVKEVPREPTTSGLTPTGSPIGVTEHAPVDLAVMDEAHAGSDSSRSWLLRWGALALVLTLTASAWWLTGLKGIGKQTSIQQPTAVAVLPFVNLTGDASKDYLGEGMADELINTLAKVPGLKVPARTSSFAYKGRNIDIRQIAKDLGVGTILEGSVRAAGKRIRISVQLINAQDGLQLWSEAYDEEFIDLFKLQDKLATQIAKALQPNLSGAAEAAVAQGPPTQDVEAYNLYLQGWALVAKPSEPNLQQAVAYFQQAIDRDPKFARAYAGIAEAHSTWLRLTWRSTEHAAAAVHFARQALALDPQLASAHNALAVTAGFRVQLFEMEAHSRKALAIDPNDGWVHTIRSISLLNTGHVREMLAGAQKGYALAPANPLVVANLALFHAIAGHDAEALKFAEAAVAMGFPQHSSPLHVVYAFTAFRAGRYAEADKHWTGPGLGLDFQSTPAVEATHLVLAALADPTRRNAALAARDRLYPKSTGNAIDLATNCVQSSWMYALLGSLDVAYDLANQCVDQLADGQVLRLVPFWTPELRAFRRDSRFQALATRLGLMEYWQQFGPPDDCDLNDGILTCH